MRRPAPRPSRRTGRGVALVVVLVALAVMGLSAMTAWRLALHSDLAAGSLLSRVQARAAAEVALRACERELLEEPRAIAVIAARPAGTAWRDRRNWEGPAAAARSIAAGAPDGARPESWPQCLAEIASIAWDGGQVVQVTARGFGADLVRGADGAPTAGAVVWLQSTLTLEGMQ